LWLNYQLTLFFLLTLLLPGCLFAASGSQNPSTDLRGIYVIIGDTITSDGSQSATDALNQALNVPGVDGVLLVIGWNSIEPAMDQYKWATLDHWMNKATSLSKKVDLAIDAGAAAPSWLFQAAPNGAGAKPLTFTVSPHSGQTGKCRSETIAAPWDSAYLSRWDLMLRTVAAHLKSVGTYTAVTLLRLTGINRTTDELRLPAETAQSTGLACVSDATMTWQQAGYRPSLLLQAWDAITDSFQKNFRDKLFSVAIIPQNPFPPIAEDGSVTKGNTPDPNQPLLSLANQKFPGHLVVQFNFLMPGTPAEPAVIQAAQTLGTFAAFQTNTWIAATSTQPGAACGGTVTSPVPCTAATYLTLLQTGIYPLSQNNKLRAQYIEVWSSNVNAFPDDILKAHLELGLSPLTTTIETTQTPSTTTKSLTSSTASSKSVETAPPNSTITAVLMALVIVIVASGIYLIRRKRQPET
jgi:hypothetical protein